MSILIGLLTVGPIVAWAIHEDHKAGVLPRDWREFCRAFIAHGKESE